MIILQDLSISTQMSEGAIESIINDHILKPGNKVEDSEDPFLNIFNTSFFLYGQRVYNWYYSCFSHL